jgi:hypothetical protein
MKGRVGEEQFRWLGCGLLPCRGFPLRGAISVCRASKFPSPLVKPDVQISRIRLSRKRNERYWHVQDQPTIDRSHGPEPKGLKVPKDRLSFRKPIGSLTATLQVTHDPLIKIPIQLVERPPRITVVIVPRPTVQPGACLADQNGQGNQATAPSGELTKLVACVG